MSLIDLHEKNKKSKKREKTGDNEKNRKSKKRKSGDEEDSVTPVKKFHISLKMQKNDGALSHQDSSSVPKKGPKIVIAKSKKTKDEEVKPQKKLNKRRKKKLEQGLPLEESVHETKGQAKAISYLKTWHTDRENWKFEKCRQIWLLHNAYESSRIEDELFPILLKYIESIKGGMRNLACDIAKKKLGESAEGGEKIDDVKMEDQKNSPVISEAAKERARQVLEILT